MKDLSFDALFPSRFLKASLFQGKPVTLTISDVSIEGLEREDGTEREAPIVSFQETKKQLVLNRTNGESIRAMFGDHINDWIGKRVTFFPERDTSGFSDFCIRVKGSPDLKNPVEAVINLPRRKPVGRKLVPTKTGAAKVVEEPVVTRAMEPDGSEEYEAATPAERAQAVTAYFGEDGAAIGGTLDGDDIPF